MVFLLCMMTQDIVDISILCVLYVVLLRILRPYIDIILHSNFIIKNRQVNLSLVKARCLALTKKKLIGIKLAFFLPSVEKNAEF